MHERLYIRRVRTAVTAVCCVVAVAAACTALLGAGLREPSRANVMAARAAVWLDRYRLVSSEVSLHGRLVRGTCYHGWFGERRGSVLRLSNGGFVAWEVRPAAVIEHRALVPDPLTALELGGCTDVLGPRIAWLAQFDPGVRLRAAWLDGRRVDELRFKRLDLLVSPTTAQPLGVLLHGAKSTIELERLTAASLAEQQERL